MRQLDSKRKGDVIQFLYKNNLIGGILPGREPDKGFDSTRKNLLNLKDGDLSGIDLSFAFLPGINLSGTILTGANLEKAYMPSANLYDIKFTKIHLKGINLTNASYQPQLKEELDKQSKN